MKLYKSVLTSCCLAIVLSSCGPKWTESPKDGFNIVTNDGGATLGYTASSGVQLLEADGFAFKDLNKDGQVNPYEDWRLPIDDRARDLAGRMSVEQIAGLMLYSSHQDIPSSGPRGSTYNGQTFAESGAKASDLSDSQKQFLTEDNLRHVLITQIETPAVAAQWNNNTQVLVEGLALGIPINISSDPRHGSEAFAEFILSANGKISQWPSTLGLAATFDPESMQQFGAIASKEYRALGIATALSPQIDLATDPRWSRFSGTMGEDPKLATDLARAYVDGFQSTAGKGWGNESVNTMVKHWPGGGPEEGGRDGHFGYGAYAVYPGGQQETHLLPFTEGAFKLAGQTQKASAVMPYYTISDGQGEAVGNSYNKYLITDVLREKYGYEGVLCTDWGITKDVAAIDRFSGMPWGVENLTVAQRHYKAIEAGMDQFVGNNEKGPVLAAYQMGVQEHGETYMRKRMEQSAVRLLKNIFQVGLFENPYLDIENTSATVGNPEFMKAGYEAQLRSIVMLKNQGSVLPIKGKQKVFVPQRYEPASTNWWRQVTPAKTDYPFNLNIIAKYFEIVDTPQEADFALVAVKNPFSGVGYDRADLQNGGNGYMPISLQYSPYTASMARAVSLAGGSPLEGFTNRSYQGKSTTTDNATDMALVQDTRYQMGSKPIIVVAYCANPMVFSEIEGNSDAILVHMGVQDQALMEIIAGDVEPSGLLPFQMPANMATVEQQFEDTPRDMIPYQDREGNTYDFAFGMNWKGVINDGRVAKYK